MANASLKTAETDRLRICMIQRALTVKKLAAACDVKRITLSNQVAKNFPSLRLRLVVESVLKVPIWSSAADFVRRQQLISSCGFDPFLLPLVDLQQHVAGFKIRGRGKDHRRLALIGLLEKHFSQQNQSKIHQP